MSQEQGRGNPLKSAEFVLVAIMVGALLIAMLFIFIFVGGTEATAQEGRKDLLAIILGAFGAWIGAGAAYFFGRENLRAATESMLRMRGASPQERLMQTTLRELHPKRFTKTFAETDNLGTILAWFDEDPERFFTLVLKDDGRVANAVDEEAIYRYLRAQMAPADGSPGVPFEDLKKHQIKEVITFIKGEVVNLEKKKPEAAKAVQALVDAAVTLEEEQTAFLANETMERERKFVTIVVDSKGVPLGYITTGEIRRLVLSAPG